MHIDDNPFTPGAGFPPPELAGRDDLLEEMLSSARRAQKGRAARSQMLLGLRGVGKTVLLNEVVRRLDDSDIPTTLIEASEDHSLAALLYEPMHKALRRLSIARSAQEAVARGLKGLKNFASGLSLTIEGVEISVSGNEPGLADSGNLEYDLPDMFELIGRAAQKAGKAWILMIDEVQYLSSRDLAALIASLHRMNQKGLPIVFFGAGLPQVARLACDAKSYAERLFLWRRLGPLSTEASRQAVLKPLAEENAGIETQALNEIVEGTKGYPFFLQTWCFNAWNAAETPLITLEDVQSVQEKTMADLDESFFLTRIDRLTERETEYIRAMAALGAGPYRVGDIARALRLPTNTLSVRRNDLILKGMIYSPKHGFLDFTVPLFDEFVRRRFPGIRTD